jgi:hypothetical protein
MKAVSIPSYVTPAAHGWVWPLGLPGFRVGDDMRSSNLYGVDWATLSPLRIAAPSAHVDPQSLRVLGAVHLQRNQRSHVLVAARDVHGRTCIGAQSGPAAPRFYCPEQLAGHVAVVIVAAVGPYGGAWPIYIDGVVSAAVTRVDVWTAGMTRTVMHGATRTVQPQGPQVDYRRSDKTWGTFESFNGQPVPWNARVDFYGVHGKLASLPLRFTRTGSYVFVR